MPKTYTFREEGTPKPTELTETQLRLMLFFNGATLGQVDKIVADLRITRRTRVRLSQTTTATLEMWVN